MLRYLVNKVEGTDAPKDNNTMSFNAPDEKPKTVRMWACDVCKKAFPDYNEACRHEEECRRVNNNNHEDDTAVHTDLTTPSGDKVSAPKIASSQTWSCDVCQKHFTEYDEACRHEESCREKERKAEQAEKASSEASKPVHHFFAKEKTTKLNSTKRPDVSQPARRSDCTSEQPGEAETKTRKRRATAKTQTEPTKKARSSANGGATGKLEKVAKQQWTKRKDCGGKAPPIADIFTSKGASQIMAEHRAAAFVAKRRADAKRERERQKRRQEQKQKLKVSLSTKSTEALIQNKPSFPTEVRFPVPSHVTTVSTMQDVKLPDSTMSWIDQHSLSEAQGRLGKTLRHQGSGKSPAEAVKDCTALRPTNDMPYTTRDPLQTALADLLVPAEIVSDGAETWRDKYTIQHVPEDVCGEQNQETARDLLRFVEEWKVERQRAHDRRAEKQRALKSEKKKGRTRKYHEEDLWSDSDDEDGGLCSVCLLTGPTASGKTSLFHAVARQSDCKLLEINTTERRGGQALKNAIEEATQSDSSLDMLKKSQIASDADPFGDTDDETEEAGNKGSSIIVILIDEGKPVY